ncbi:vesicle transport protein SEC20 [Drosophila sulfurigaster albostrigata]|uniref:vesicle transport protein SEC20 n=1 Tax=Drosophila sulfurigaster albostrigata TaxID=89887 RepID=UPI002D218D0E|nr:vesicle transport protein SEC20 [Drosophila sulfurigaster albostrigata]
MDKDKFTLQTIRQDLIDNNLQAKAIIQDILNSRSSIAELEELNEAGRAKLSAIRKNIERLDDWARDMADPALANEVDTHRDQFSKTLQAFRKANVSTMLEIEKANREELMAITGESDLRHRNTSAGGARHNRGSRVSQENDVTEKMLAISRHLSETTQKSAVTLETLVASSQNVEATQDELHNTAGSITQSGKLLKKYGRRECTDKMLLFFAFSLFLACVFYIVQKRLF